MSMNLSEKEIKEWWEEFEAELAKMVLPDNLNSPPPQEKLPSLPKWVEGNVYYTLINDRQFAVDSTYPKAKGWNYG